MIITDGKERFIIDKKYVTNKKDGYVIGINEDFWCIELFLKKDGNRLIKRLPSKQKDGGDELKSYKIIDKPNKKEYLFSNTDYNTLGN